MEFLFENPFILIIIIGIVSSLYKKFQANSQEERKRKTQWSPSANKQVRRTPIKQKSAIPKIEPEKNIQAEYKKAKDKAEKVASEWNQTEIQMPKRTKMENAKLTEGSTSSKPVPGNLVLDEQKLVDAIIWSEIIGPPRSKKPHQTFKR